MAEQRILEWISSLDHGRAVLAVEVPDGNITAQDAQDVLDWFDVISRRFKRLAAQPPTSSPSPPGGAS